MESWKSAFGFIIFHHLKNKIPIKASVGQKQNVVRANSANYNLERTAYVYQKDGDIFYKETITDEAHTVFTCKKSANNNNRAVNLDNLISFGILR
jgi:hypothetical protein